MLYVMLILLGFSSFAISKENFTYQLKGNYTLNKKKVNYVLRWSENEDDIHGIYKDDFIKKEKRIEGEIKNEKRVFIIPEKVIIKARKEDVKKISHEIPVEISLITGSKVHKEKSEGSFSATAAIIQKQEEEECIHGFGALASYCGSYEGLVTEGIDRQGRCELLSSDNLGLEVRKDRSVRVYLENINGKEGLSYHEIGRIPLNAGSSKIDLKDKNCKPLKGLLPLSSKCKRLNLEGEFTTIGGKQSFQGTYQIFDERTMNTCTYSLSLSRIEE